MYHSSNKARHWTILLQFFALASGLPIAAQQPSPTLKDANSDYRAGMAALSRNDLNTALMDLQNAVRLAPSTEEGHSVLGVVLLRMGRTKDAVRELEKALAIKPSDVSVQTNLAFAYERTGRAAKAVPLFAKVEASAHSEGHPFGEQLLVSYAHVLAATTQFSLATVKLKEAVAADPKNAELQDDLGSLYSLRQDWPNAEAAFSAALVDAPDLAIAHLHLGLALQQQRKSGALDEISKANELMPANPAITLQLGVALAMAGRNEQTLPILRKALELAPTSAAAQYQLGLALQRAGNVDEAIALLRRVAAEVPQDAEVQINLGMALSQSQQAKEAVPILQKAIALAPKNAVAHQNLAAAYIQLNQLDDAVTQLQLALKLTPNAPQLHYDLGLALKMKDDAVDAIPELKAAQSLNPDAPEPPYVLGMLYMQTGDYPEAESELSRSLKLRPENGDAWATIGSVYNKLDRLSDATQALREAIRQLPQQPDAHLTLAAVLVKQGRASDAAQERKTAAELMLGSMNLQRAEVATNAANSQLKSGDVEGAVAQLKEALKFDPKYVDAHLSLATALDRQGKAVKAAAERQQAEQLKAASR